MSIRRHARTLALTLAIVAAACGGDDDATPATGETPATATVVGPATSSAPSPVSSTSSSTVTTEPIATSASTSSAPTTSSTPGTTATSTPVTTTAEQPVPAPTGPAPATAVTVDGFDLVERDVATGEVVRTISADFIAEATYPGDFTLDADRSQLYFAESTEDYWFSCESSPSQVLVADLATGARTVLGRGASPALSPDGTRLAYLEASQCLPDPQAPDFWVLTPLDRVVVVDLASGDRSEFPTSELPTADDDPLALAWVGFAADGTLLVATVGGELRSFDPAVPGDVSAGEVVAELGDRRPVGIGGGSIVATVTGVEGSVDVYRIDPSGSPSTLLARSEYPIGVGVSTDGHVIVDFDASLPAPTDVAAGVALMPIDGNPAGIAW